MENFESVKARVLAIAKEKEACSGEAQRAENATTIEELLQVVKDNFLWSCRNGILAPEMVEAFGIETLNKNQLYINQDASEGFLFAFDSATVRAFDSATVLAFDSATVEASDSATVRAFGSAKVRASDYATVEAFDYATVRASDSATVRAFGSAKVRASDYATVEASDSATVRASDSATVLAFDSATVRAFGFAYINSYSSIDHQISENAICRYYHENRVVIADGVKSIQKKETNS